MTVYISSTNSLDIIKSHHAVIHNTVEINCMGNIVLLIRLGGVLLKL